jgi:hypothetical protein
LSFIPGGNKTGDLTERRFGSAWCKTKGKEAERFAQVLQLLDGPALPGRPHKWY